MVFYNLEKNRIIVLLIVSVLTFSIFEIPYSGQAKTNFDIMNTTSDQCPTPTDFVTVSIKGGLFNVDRLNVPADSCVRITLQNLDNIDHTFTINKVGGSPDLSKNDANLSLQEINFFNIYAMAGSKNSSNLMTPKVSSDFEFYCEISGHEGEGEWGFLMVSEPFRNTLSSEILPILTLLIIAGASFVFLTIYSKKKVFLRKSPHQIPVNNLEGDIKFQCPQCYSKMEPQETTCQKCGAKI